MIKTSNTNLNKIDTYYNGELKISIEKVAETNNNKKRWKWSFRYKCAKYSKWTKQREY